MRAAARANRGARRRTNAVVRSAAQGKMMPGLPAPVALWWALIVVYIAFISWVLTKLGINICRGSVFDNPQGRVAVVLLFVHLDDTDEGVISQSVFLTNVFFSPFVRFVRWSNGLVYNMRRNSCVPASVFYTARLPRYLIGSATSASRPSSTPVMRHIYLDI